LLAAAIGVHADSAPLRQLCARLTRLSAHASGTRNELLRSLHAIEAEARSGAGGSRHYLAAHLTIALVLMWRLAARELATSAAAPTEGHSAQRLQRFRHLVEAQFRDHWTMARYAAELSLTPDRLHDLCVRALGRAPTALVHQRLVREACLLLASSDLSIERLGAELGFGSASHFSRFFKRWMALAPKAYRAQSRQRVSTGQDATPQSYADWP
ncbi:MAG: AraC family transcriptional regulator, partial [Rubrivivax sp.]|nr:AraC family transcriptional regulator [Rubrivivax sp.]